MTAEFDFAAIDTRTIAESLGENGFALTKPFLSTATCARLSGYYDNPATQFRSTISMARHNFGRGEYKYFAYPLPAEVQALREYFYAHLAPIANEWERRFGNDRSWPESLDLLLHRCHEEGQGRPTPLLLRYGAGDYNCLHQDLYGPLHFPLQVIILLSEPGQDFAGGELILVEQRPRLQSRPIVVRLTQGAAAIIPVRERPRQGTRGYHRAPMRHGVGEVISGERYTLGLIFHDAA